MQGAEISTSAATVAATASAISAATSADAAGSLITEIPGSHANTTCGASADHQLRGLNLLISRNQSSGFLMSDPTPPMVWPALLPTFLFFGGLASAALLTQLIT